MLRLLQSEKYVCKVKEEIIVVDPKNNLIKDYLVIQEKARFSLFDLLKIWNSEELSNKFVEFYTPQKLLYYIFQAM